MKAVNEIKKILANGGADQVIMENQHKLTKGDLSTAKPAKSQAQKNREKLDALRKKIHGK